MENFGAIIQVPLKELVGPAIYCPLGMKIKSSDLARARVITGINIKNENDLEKANLLLLEQGSTKVKVRITTDATAVGLNDVSYKPPFRYPSVSDAFQIIEQGDYLCKGDVNKYYLNFPLAECCHWLFQFIISSVIWKFLRVFFGLSSSPFYASTWSAEFRSWILKLGIPCVVMMDDWLHTKTFSPEFHRFFTTGEIHRYLW